MKLNLSMWKNENKKSDKSPDYFLSQYDKETGTSVKYGAGWMRQTQTGKRFISLVVEKQEEQPKQGYKITKQEGVEEQEIDISEIPF